LIKNIWTQLNYATQYALHSNAQQIFRLINIDNDIPVDSFMLSAKMARGDF